MHITTMDSGSQLAGGEGTPSAFRLARLPSFSRGESPQRPLWTLLTAAGNAAFLGLLAGGGVSLLTTALTGYAGMNGRSCFD